MLKKILIGIPVLVIVGLFALYFLFPSTVFALARDAERGAAGLVQKEITVGDHNIVYLEGGTGETLLLLHGFGGDKDNWTRFSKSLTGSYHVVALDMPGWGESTYLPTETYGVTKQVARLKAITTALGIKKYHVAGNSMGGWIAGALAATYPDDVLSLGLIDNAGITTPKKSELQILFESGTNPLLVNSIEDFDRLLAFIFVTVPDIPGPVKGYLAETSALRRPLNEKLSADLFADPVALEPLLPALTMPTMVMWGTEDRLIDVSAVGVMRPLLQNATYYVLENTGHSPMIEKPEETAAQYLEFLAKARG
ncbi:MAG: alpha/beta hydrolase [Kordiimonadales bacterium]|nr:MAG: alpha/beta hydrolase [Kordiimonadales bacterium]